jgi:hypothetical protein
MAKGAELRHWSDMLATPRRPIAKWHTLKEIKGDPISVLLHNGGSCNASTLKRCVTFRCITKQTMLLNVAIPKCAQN